jgi:hypothetical protein
VLVGLVGILCLAVVVDASAQSSEVLGPGQEVAAKSLLNRVSTTLGAQVSVGAIRLRRDALATTLTIEGKSWPLEIHGPSWKGPKQSDVFLSPHGMVLMPLGLPPAQVRALKKALLQPPSALKWQKVSIAKRAPPPKAPSPAFGPDRAVLVLDKALKAMASGDLKAVREQVKPLLGDPRTTPQGAYSLWLAAGGKPMGLPDEMAQQYPMEPRLHAQLALKNWREGTLERAARHLNWALHLAPHDGLALRLASEAGWSPPSHAVVLPDVLDVSPSPLPWMVGGLCAFLLLGWVGLKGRDSAALVILAAGVVAFFLIDTENRLEPVPPQSVVAMAASHEGCGLSPVGWSPVGDQMQLMARCRGQNVVLELSSAAGTTRRPFMVVGDLQVNVKGALGKAVEAQLRALKPAIDKARKEGLKGLSSALDEGAKVYPMRKHRTASERIQIRLMGAIALMALLALLVWLFRFSTGLARRPGWSQGQIRWFWMGLVVAAVIHILVPGRLLMVFQGYPLVEQLAAGDIPRYGPGSVWLYGPLQWLNGPDHHQVFLLNRIYGWLTVLAVGGLTARLWPDAPKRAVGVVWLLALLPVVWRTHGSESILVAPTLAVMVALAWSLEKERASLVLPAILLLAAALTRVEMAIMCLFFWGWWTWGARAEGASRVEDRLAWLSIFIVAGVAVWQSVYTVEAMVARGALPATELGLGPILAAMTAEGIFMDARCFPLVLGFFMIWTVVESSTRRLAWTTGLVTLAWLGLTGVDHTPASTPRTHLPMVFLMAPLMVAGIDLFWARVKAGKTPIRVFAGLLCLGLLGGAAYSGVVLHTPNNDDAESQLWDELVEKVDEKDVCLVALGDGDPPARGRTPRHNPEYQVTSRHPSWSIYPIGALDSVLANCKGPVYALLGMRCYGQIREPHEPIPPGNAMLSPCAKLYNRAGRENVIDWDIANEAIMSHPMYPAGSPLKIGIYRVQKKK